MEQPLKRIEMGLCEGCAEVENWKTICRRLAEACQYGLNLNLNGVGQHTHAIVLFEAVLAEARKARIIPEEKEAENG